MIVKQREKKKAKFRISFVFLIIFASFAVCFTLYMKEDFQITEDMFEDETEAVVYIDPVGQSSFVENPVPQSERQDESYYKDAVFVGSKALAGLSDYGYVKSENMLISDSIKLDNFDTAVLSANGKESGIKDAVLQKNPSKVYIMVGLYDLDRLESADLFKGLESVIDGIRDENGELEIYLVSLLPVTAERESDTASNTDIDAYNTLLIKFANKVNVNYLDVNTNFKGNDGKLPSSYAETNGIRLSRETYEKFSEYILTHVRG
ncbi:MAG: hypothetical protein J6C96_06385 [Oscillospiraceae bacterium]|nr:hypothetical protein [Oscillospiraceae bacterium]